MSAQARNRLLSLLENLPRKRLIILTTTEEEVFKNDPILFSRLLRVAFCKPHIDHITALLKGIALAETGNGAALPYERIIRDNRSNIRACIQALEVELLSA